MWRSSRSGGTGTRGAPARSIPERVPSPIRLDPGGTASIVGTMTARLDGRTIAVPGAGGGIGRGMAVASARGGAHVFVSDIRREPREGGAPTDELVREAGGRATWVTTDVSRWED